MMSYYLLKGLNRLAAVLLLFLDEEESFWGLVAIIECLMPERYYDHTLIAAHADQVRRSLFLWLKIAMLLNLSSSSVSFDRFFALLIPLFSVVCFLVYDGILVGNKTVVHF